MPVVPHQFRPPLAMHSHAILISKLISHVALFSGDFQVFTIDTLTALERPVAITRASLYAGSYTPIEFDCRC